MLKDATNFTATEILSLCSQGEKFKCPVCGRQLVTIPENLSFGTRPAGIKCPENPNHYLIYGDDAQRMLEMRKRMGLS